MTPQEKLIEYAKKYNNEKVLTHEEFIGKARLEGVAIARTPNSVTTANVRREGKTIIITETTKTRTQEIVGGKLEFVESIETVEALRIEL